MLNSIDRSLFLLLNDTLANPVFDFVFRLIDRENSWIIPAMVAAIVFVAKKKKHAWVVLACIVAVVAISDPLCVRILKPLVARFRPCHPSYFVDGQHMFIEGANFWCGTKGSFSFPSAHAMNSFATMTVLTLFYPKRWGWFLTIASLSALSRVYVGIHYPSDILAGALFGISIGAGVYFAYRYVRRLSVSRREAPTTPSEVLEQDRDAA